jgi:bis(5'-nucleosidyl)-tetraphosphatase
MEKHETSIGAVVVNSKNQFLLLFSRRSSYWCFPKGHMESQEDEKATMRRELLEETGIKNFSLIKGFREEEDYSFDREGYNTKKKAVFYLLKTDDPVIISIEHTDFKWVDYEEALKLVKYEAQRVMIRKAYEFLGKKTNYYDEIADGYDELHGAEQLRKANIIISKLSLKKTDKLLDVGCGNGSYLELFDCKVTGIDPSEELIKQYKGKHKLTVGVAEELPFPDNSFGIVMSITAMHNFRNIETGIKEMRRVGKKKFVFSVLKKTKKMAIIEKLIYDFFTIDEIIDEDKDIIFFCSKK